MLNDLRDVDDDDKNASLSECNDCDDDDDDGDVLFSQSTQSDFLLRVQLWQHLSFLSGRDEKDSSSRMPNV